MAVTKNSFDKDLSLTKQYLGWTNQEVVRFNEELRGAVEGAVNARSHRLGEAAEGLAERNTCIGNEWAGIAITDQGTRPTIRGNRCHDNGTWGIVSWNDATPDIGSDNTASGNKKGQIAR